MQTSPGTLSLGFGSAPPNEPGRPTCIEVAAVSKTYSSKRGSLTALDQVSFHVAHGEFVSILGPSGCGKSTLLRILGGLSPATSGSVRVDGAEVKSSQTQMGVVFQHPVLLPWRNVLQNVLIQAEARGLDKAAAKAQAQRLLASVGLSGFETRRPNELSGGMQQRVAICRALLHDPSIILLDEPFGALDALTRDQMTVDLQKMMSRGDKSIVFITHSVEEAVFLSDRVLVMTPRPGRIDLDLAIDLPRPRKLRIKTSPEFTAHAQQIRESFAARGVLNEDD